MERRVRGNSHARCGVGENPEIASKDYLSLLPGAFSSGTPHGEDFRIVLEEIARLHRPGLSVPRPVCGRWKPAGAIRVDDTFSLAWRVLAAEYWGVAQRRHRIFLVADLAGASAEKILFDYCGVSRNPAPGGGTWQAVAESVSHCFADTSWLDALAGKRHYGTG